MPDALEIVELERVALAPGEVARLLGVSWDTVTRWRQAGVLPATRIGRRWYIQTADVRALLTPRSV